MDHRLRAEAMAFEVVDPQQLLAGEVFSEDLFLTRADEYDWGQFRGKKVLVRGCQSVIIPLWVYMYITGKLVPVARSVRYGNEHDNIVVYRSPK